MIVQLRDDLKKLTDPEKAKIYQRFFKTGRGQYGEGDLFLGATVPQSRGIAKKYSQLPFKELSELLKSKYHEERLIALFILVDNFKKGDEGIKDKIYQFYLKNTQYINNWDLVDSSAPQIVGHYLAEEDKQILLKLAVSNSLWEKRIAILSTFYFIRFQKNSDWTFKIAKILLNDKHDLIHKAVGWMLREAGKNISKEVEKEFLNKHYQIMPRTMLRYAIEHFNPQEKAFYMKKT
jgi:3-methyladenine DNA glycosylase AlkD